MSAPQDERNTTRTPSLRQRALNASARNSTIDAARAPSVSEQPNEKTAAFEQCNELESQTSNKDPSVKDEKEDLAEVPKDQKTEATPERLGEKIARVRASTWWLLGALILAIPLSIFATTYSATTIDGIRVTGLFVWLEIFWTSGWLIYFFVWFVGKAWNVLCRLGFDKWDDILLDTAWSQRGFFLALVTYGSSWVMCDFSTGTCDAYWLHILQKVLLAAVPALGIFLIKDLLLEVIMIRQSMRMVEGKQELVLRQFEAFRIMFSGDESEETFRHKVSLWCQQFWLGLQGKNGGIFLRKRTPTTDDFDSMLSRYCEGEGKDEDFVRNGKAFVDAIRDTCRTNYIEMFTDEDSGEVMQNFEESFFQYILDQPHKDSFLLNGRPLTAKEMLKMMDRDGNGCVNIEEWVEANAENIMAFRDINKSIAGIKSAAKAVNAVISCLLMCVVAIIYAAFFTKNLTSYLTPIWTTVTGLSFALSGTVTEFITACSFVFSKQPYDIGDRVVIEEKDLIVDEICLLYTVFHRRSDGAVEQIAHQKVSDAWITNLSRSKSLSVKEAVTIPDSIVTVSQADLDKHQEELRKHINENPVRSRYLKALDFRVSLQSGKSGGRELVADIKLQDLVVRREDILANVRNSVRDKMEELVRPPLVTQ